MKIIIDTGPLVALLDKRDTYHKFCDRRMRQLKAPFYTCESVITESFFLLQSVAQGVPKFIKLLESDKLRIDFTYKD